MSYDISMVINTGILNHTVVDIGNYTYNIAPMYNKAFGKDWKFIDGMKGEDAAPIIKNAYEEMVKNNPEYKLLNPKNGWGNYEGALDYLDRIYKSCLKHPLASIYIS